MRRRVGNSGKGEVSTEADIEMRRFNDGHEQGGHDWAMHEGRQSRPNQPSTVVTLGKLAWRWRLGGVGASTNVLAKSGQASGYSRQ